MVRSRRKYFSVDGINHHHATRQERVVRPRGKPGNLARAKVLLISGGGGVGEKNNVVKLTVVKLKLVVNARPFVWTSEPSV